VNSLNPEKALIFRIAHISNVPWVLDHGLHCRNSAERDPNFVEIGNPELILKRINRTVPISPGGLLRDYIPFYFTPHSPMLYNIKTGHNGITRRPMNEIVVWVSSLPKLATQNIPFVFTDRHPLLLTATFHNKLARLDCIAWTLLQNRDFKRDLNDPGKFERYQAETLVHRHLPITALSAIICHGDAQKDVLQRELERRGQTLQVAVRPNWYF
jgi:hypothetical protein